jgi:hypothetical protein
VGTAVIRIGSPSNYFFTLVNTAPSATGTHPTVPLRYPPLPASGQFHNLCLQDSFFLGALLHLPIDGGFADASFL